MTLNHFRIDWSVSSERHCFCSRLNGKIILKTIHVHLSFSWVSSSFRYFPLCVKAKTRTSLNSAENFWFIRKTLFETKTFNYPDIYSQRIYFWENVLQCKANSMLHNSWSIFFRWTLESWVNKTTEQVFNGKRLTNGNSFEKNLEYLQQVFSYDNLFLSCDPLIIWWLEET